jgi:tRNA pseudouridine38-40 synthase
VKIDFQDGLIQRIVISANKTHKKRLVLNISYDGSGFFGFQSQKTERSVQSELEFIVSRINGEPTSVQGASRTDTGVHALDQVIHFDTKRTFDLDRWVSLLNHQLPKDIHVISANLAPPLFHSRYDAKRKTYRYLINTGEADPLKRKYEANFHDIDLKLLEENLRQLIGMHDFTSFCSGKKENKIRTIFDAHYETNGTRIELYFTGDGFLHHMIRLIVAQLFLIASGQSPKSISEIIAERSRKTTTKLAPSSGLYLIEVAY